MTEQGQPSLRNPQGNAAVVAASSRPADAGLIALASIAGHYHIPVDPFQVAHDLGLAGKLAGSEDIVRAAIRIGLKAKCLEKQTIERLLSVPTPCIIRTEVRDEADASKPPKIAYELLLDRLSNGKLRIGDPVSRTARDITPEEFKSAWDGNIILIARRWGGAGATPTTFAFRWFLPSIWRYRFPLGQVLLASLFVQLFAMTTPLLFQVVIDKVLTHRSYSSLLVIVAALIMMGFFDVLLQYLRTYILSHTTSRVDVELGSRLFDHLVRLPLSYFETRAAGQTIARVRELETIRAFLTGPALSSILDVPFIALFIVVMFIYSTPLTLIVLVSIPLYVLVAVLIRPAMRTKINERFNAGALSQQFLVETVVGIQTLKSAAVEPLLRNQWEERLAGYVRTSFQAVMLAALGQNAIQFINKVTTAAVLFVGAKAVMDNELTVGGLVAFNMMMAQVTQPILRLSQLWQDFQQVQTSVERVGDVLNSPVESQRLTQSVLPQARGHIRLSEVSFRYRSDTADILRNISLDIPAGQVIGIIGPSGSGKSTLTKLLQRLYKPDRGQVLIDGTDVSQVDTAWVRRQIGVVLQENNLFNRSIHDNIALANPGMHRAHVTAMARLAGADEFISKLPLGYDTIIEERGANLSGGQRQRIAIARALATQPRILILDEATSALDYESEEIIQRNMRQISQGRTVVIIAHRLTAVMDCHRIIGLDNGVIVEQGTHSELLAKPLSLYGRMWRAQSRQVAG